MVTTDRPQYSVIGTRPVRPDGVDKVTGRAQYGADIQLTGMLFGKVKRSPHAHARIVKRIDTSKAEALPGVRAVVTAADLPEADDRVQEMGESSANLRELSNNVLATDKVLYRGHAVAAVAATNWHIALRGPRPDRGRVRSPAGRARRARRHAPRRADPARRPAHAVDRRHVRRPDEHRRPRQFAFGDPAAAFAEADVVVEREFNTKMVHQGYIEPHTSTAIWNQDGEITIWTSTQGTFAVRDQMAEVLRHPGLEDEGHPDGDRRRLRRQDRHLPRPGRRDPLAQERAAR